MSRMNLSGYIGHVTINIHYCVLFSSRVTVRIRFSVWLVGCFAHLFVLLYVVIVTDWSLFHNMSY